MNATITTRTNTRANTRPLRAGIALVALAGASAGLLSPMATSTAQAAAPAPASSTVTAHTVKIWAEGQFTKGQDLYIDAYAGSNAHGVAYTRATVVGPHGMKATLSPAADAGYLTGSIHVPASLRGSWFRLTLLTPGGRTATVVVHQKAARPAAHVASSPVKIWTTNGFRKGHDLDVFADAGTNAKGVSFTRATVVGPHGIKATLSPAADAGCLVGTVHVPASLRGSWIRLTLVTPDGHRASVVVHRA